jgi:hypothetical protein
LDVRSLLKGLPVRTGIYEVGDDAVVEILEEASVVPHNHVRGVWPPEQVLEGEFQGGPVFAYRLKNAIVNVETGAVYDAQGRLIREAFGTVAVLNRYMKFAELPDPSRIVDAAGPILPLATTRSGNYCRWWLDSMAKVYVAAQSSFADLYPVPTIYGARKRFQQDALVLLDDVRMLDGAGPRFFRGDVINSPGVTYNGGQRIGEMVVDLGRTFAKRGLDRISDRGPLPRKLFITRNKASIRRIVDEEVLSAQLAEEGFVTLELEKLPLVSQMAYFAAADIIVSPHGAGLTNLLWAKPGMTLVEIFPDGGVHGSAFFRMASQMGLNYYAVVGAAGENRDRKDNPNNADIVLDVPAMMDFLRAKVMAEPVDA